jgi:hypothetical protein
MHREENEIIRSHSQMNKQGDIINIIVEFRNGEVKATWTQSSVDEWKLSERLTEAWGQEISPEEIPFEGWVVSFPQDQGTLGARRIQP